MDDTLITRLAKARDELLKAQQNLDKFEKAYKASDEYMRLKTELDQANEEIGIADQLVRQEALKTYEEDMLNPHPHPAVLLKIYQKTEYDESVALQWCRENFTPALKLNTGIFEKAVLQRTIPSEIAKVVADLRVFIDKDLSAYLPKTAEEKPDNAV